MIDQRKIFIFGEQAFDHIFFIQLNGSGGIVVLDGFIDAEK